MLSSIIPRRLPKTQTPVVPFPLLYVLQHRPRGSDLFIPFLGLTASSRMTIVIGVVLFAQGSERSGDGLR